MKWANKGHELDEIGAKIASFTKVAIFCAGTNGIELFNLLKRFTKLEVVAFLDNDEAKQGTDLYGIRVFSPEEWFSTTPTHDTAIVVTVHNRDVQRVIIRQLEKEFDIRYNSYVFITHKFFPIYMWYKYNKLIAFNTIYSLTQHCNLKCKHCNSFMQYISNPKHMELSDVKRDIDLMFSTFDYTHILNFFGGETTLYPKLPEILSYVFENYSHLYGTLGIATNAFTKPSKNLIDAIINTKTIVNISNYAQYFTYNEERQQQFAKFVKVLKDNNIPHYIEGFSSHWFDYGFETIDRLNASDTVLQQVFDVCDMHCRLMQDGKYYNCAYDKLAININIHSQDSGLDLRNFCKGDGASLLEYSLGYSEKGFVELCRICDGSGSTRRVTPAVQAEQKLFLRRLEN